MVILSQTLKLQKHAKNDSTSMLKLIYAKTGSKKQLMFEKKMIPRLITK